MLEKLAAISVITIRKILGEMPNSWLTDQQRGKIDGFWSDGRRDQRLKSSCRAERMTRRHPYVVIKVADAVRGEALNAAITVLEPSGAEVRLPRRLDKLRALSHALDLDTKNVVP